MVKRIIYVEGNVDTTVGGSYFSLLYLTARLDRSRFEPVVVFAADNDLRIRFREHGITTFVRPLLAPVAWRGGLGRACSKTANFVRGWIVEPIRLALLLRRERIDLVHLNNSIIKNHPWMIASWLARRPCITHERGINSQFKRRARILARSLDAIICISSAVYRNFLSLGLGHLPLHIVHNGLDAGTMRVTRSAAEVRDELSLPPDCRIIGMVGNIRKWKGQEVLVRAMALVAAEFPQATCLLLGGTSHEDRQYKHMLEGLISELGLAGRVLICGYRTDVANYINSFELQVHASIEPEPFGRVLLEGMALAKPLVASRAGAVPEIVVDGQTGLLFDPGNPVALAACLRKLLESPGVSAEMGRAGHARLVECFSSESTAKQVEAIYDRIVG